MSDNTYTSSFKVKGKQLLNKINELAKEGNVRRIIIKNKAGKEIVRFPMTLGVAAAVLAPLLASIGLIAFFVTECTVILEKTKK